MLWKFYDSEYQNRSNSSLKISFSGLLSQKKSYNGCCSIIDSKTFKRAKAKIGGQLLVCINLPKIVGKCQTEELLK